MQSADCSVDAQEASPGGNAAGKAEARSCSSTPASELCDLGEQFLADMVTAAETPSARDSAKGGCITQDSHDTANGRWGHREIYFKELAHAITGISRAEQQAYK